MTTDPCCGVCGTAMHGATKRCPACDTPHHFDCWEFAEGCSVYGCAQRLGGSLPAPVPSGSAASPAVRATSSSPATGLAEVARSLTRRVFEALAHIPDWLWRPLGALLLIVSPLPALAGLAYSAGRWGRPGLVAYLFVLLLYGLSILLMVSGGMTAFLRDVAESYAPRKLVVQDTRKHLEARLAEAPNNVHLLEALGLELLRLGELDEAIEVYDKAMLAKPRNQPAAFYKARCLLDANRAKAAGAVLRQAVHMDPNSRLAARAERLLAKLEK